MLSDVGLQMRTSFNRRSLSCSIIQLTVKLVAPSTSHPSSSSATRETSASYFLVDLASVSTGNEQEAQGSNIYKSLYTLRLILQRLSEPRGSSSSVPLLPFRESKLSRLLKPCLEGASR